MSDQKTPKNDRRSGTTQEQRMAKMTTAGIANWKARREKRDVEGGEAAVCFKLPRSAYLQIQRAAELEHRSAANYMWHHAFLMAESQLKDRA